MPICKFCSVPFAWGQADGKWVPLIPVGEEGEHDRTYQDENGALRVQHAVVCVNRGGPAVRVVKLAAKVPAKDVLPLPEHVEAILKKKAEKKARRAKVDVTLP